MSYFQVNDQCNGCLACVQNCPAKALDFKDQDDSRTLLHNMARCARCATCYRVCPKKAVEFEHLLRNQWDEVVNFSLIRCTVCHEPIHTSQLKPTLEEKLAKLAEPLCPLHRAHLQGSLQVGAKKAALNPKGRSGS